MADNKKLHPVDLVGIGNLLEHAVAEKTITCEQRDRIIKRIADENGFEDYTLPVLAGYKRSKDEVMERAAHREAAVSQLKDLDESYISLTEVA